MDDHSFPGCTPESALRITRVPPRRRCKLVRAFHSLGLLQPVLLRYALHHSGSTRSGPGFQGRARGRRGAAVNLNLLLITPDRQPNAKAKPLSGHVLNLPFAQLPAIAVEIWHEPEPAKPKPREFPVERMGNVFAIRIAAVKANVHIADSHSHATNPAANAPACHARFISRLTAARSKSKVRPGISALGNGSRNRACSLRAAMDSPSDRSRMLTPYSTHSAAHWATARSAWRCLSV